MIAARRTYPVVFPIVLILAGAVVLLANLGTLPQDAGWRLLQLWPLLLVMLGVQLLIPHMVHGAAVPAVTLLLVCVIALGGFAYALAGPSLGTGTYTRFHSTSPIASQTKGTITIDGAPEQITITARDIGPQLYDAKVDYVGSAPRFSYADGNVRISRDSNIINSWGRRRDVVDLSISPAVAWTIVIDAAGTTTKVDLSSAKLQSFKLNGAWSTVMLTAGPPQGVVSVSVSGVGNSLTVSLPATAEYRAAGEGIATNVDGTAYTPGWSTAQDRYDVSVTGVVSRATVTGSG